jgi:hypothetical protein
VDEPQILVELDRRRVVVIDTEERCLAARDDAPRDDRDDRFPAVPTSIIGVRANWGDLGETVEVEPFTRQRDERVAIEDAAKGAKLYRTRPERARPRCVDQGEHLREIAALSSRTKTLASTGARFRATICNKSLVCTTSSNAVGKIARG